MGGFISAPPNLASPSAIGSTTPNTGAFTTLSATPPANTTAFTSTGFSLTGTNAQTLLNLSGTWNTSGTPTAIKLNVTDTASNASSLLMDLQTGGSSVFSINKLGRITFGGVANTSISNAIVFPTGYGSTFKIESDINNGIIIVGQGATTHIGTQVRVTANTTAGYAWQTGGAISLAMYYDANNILAQRNSTNAQAFKLYRTFTDASNYERLGFLATNTTRYTITSENAGTGSARSLEVSFYTAASDPTSTDITSGCFSVWKNSGTGTIKLWANDGGTMKSVALA